MFIDALRGRAGPAHRWPPGTGQHRGARGDNWAQARGFKAEPVAEEQGVHSCGPQAWVR